MRFICVCCSIQTCLRMMQNTIGHAIVSMFQRETSKLLKVRQWYKRPCPMYVFGAETEQTALPTDRKLVTLSSLHVRLMGLFNVGKSTESKLEQSGYSSWKLKEKLKQQFRGKLLFIAQPGMSNLVWWRAKKKFMFISARLVKGSGLHHQWWYCRTPMWNWHVYHASSSSWFPSQFSGSNSIQN